MNPTGSFKDRGMTVALSRAVEHGAMAVICASTGNTRHPLPPTRPTRASLRLCWCRRARSRWASSVRRSCTAVG
ncbi:pyridoxal-phosphate dependent enzyme [Microbacterium laevaniformans]|uniref:pyridoxal-phosphate dependent enzyme n=1 Tax=Microbacterium laevaniformans TaxID=36807 RepID=UPI0031EC09A5